MNLAIVMLLGGLWHGAAWNFVVWGGLHGVWLAAERALGKRSLYGAWPRPARVAFTFLGGSADAPESVELRLLDLASGAETRIAAGGIQPAWSRGVGG